MSDIGANFPKSAAGKNGIAVVSKASVDQIAAAYQHTLKTLIDREVRCVTWRTPEDLDEVFAHRGTLEYLIIGEGLSITKSILLTMALVGTAEPDARRQSRAHAVGISSNEAPSEIRDLFIERFLIAPVVDRLCRSSYSAPSLGPADVQTAQVLLQTRWHSLSMRLSKRRERSTTLVLSFLRSYPHSSLVRSLLDDVGESVCRIGSEVKEGWIEKEGTETTSPSSLNAFEERFPKFQEAVVELDRNL